MIPPAGMRYVRHVNAVHRHAMTQASKRTHGRSAFTQRGTHDLLQQLHASGGPRLRDGPTAGRERGGSPGDAGTHPADAEGIAGHAQGSRSYIRRVLHLDPCVWPALGRVRRRDGIPASALSVIASRITTVVLSACCNERSRSAEVQAILRSPSIT